MFCWERGCPALAVDSAYLAKCQNCSSIFFSTEPQGKKRRVASVDILALFVRNPVKSHCTRCLSFFINSISYLCPFIDNPDKFKKVTRICYGDLLELIGIIDERTQI